MTTNNWREEYRKLDSVRRCIFMQKEVEDFIETQIAQAEKRGEERMKEKVKKSISEFEALDIKDQIAIYISSL